MSALTATKGGPPVPIEARIPVLAKGNRYPMSNRSSSSRTNRLVSNSSNASSGCSWILRRIVFSQSTFSGRFAKLSTSSEQASVQTSQLRWDEAVGEVRAWRLRFLLASVVGLQLRQQSSTSKNGLAWSHGVVSACEIKEPRRNREIINIEFVGINFVKNWLSFILREGEIRVWGWDYGKCVCERERERKGNEGSWSYGSARGGRYLSTWG